jgi:hypothetical protein
MPRMKVQTGSPGRVDDIAERVLEETKSQAVIVMTVGGPNGPGLSMACRHPWYHQAMPGFLRAIADDIERAEGPSGMRISMEPHGEG